MHLLVLAKVESAGPLLALRALLELQQVVLVLLVERLAGQVEPETRRVLEVPLMVLEALAE